MWITFQNKELSIAKLFTHIISHLFLHKLLTVEQKTHNHVVNVFK